MPPEVRRYCRCKPTCGKLLTKRTRRDHDAKVPPGTRLRSLSPSPAASPAPSLPVDSEMSSDFPSNPPSPMDLRGQSVSRSPSPMQVEEECPSSDDEDPVFDYLASGSEDETEDPIAPEPLTDAEPDPWSGFDEFQDVDEPLTLDDMADRLAEMLEPEDHLDVNEQRALYDDRNDLLDDKDRDNIRAFSLKLVAQMPRAAYNQMVYTFRHKLDLSSEWVMLHRIAVLARVEPQYYHCCVNSCLAYTGGFAELDECPYCEEPRLSAGGKPRRLFCYLPIIPRLQGYFLNTDWASRLMYRHNYIHIPGSISDVFDGEHYRNLCTQNVVVDGKTLEHKYFSDERDLCLGIAMDSYLLFKRNRGGPSATPIVVQNYCIHPETRTHIHGGLIPVGVVPGPHPPKNTYSFLIPYDDECAKLAVGVKTFDSMTRCEFILHAYNIFEMGDIIAIEKSLNIKGHNSFSPCRSCQIKGVRNVTAGQKIYYVPLTWPNGRTWDPDNLPMRTPEHLEEVVKKLDARKTLTSRNKLAKFHGIKGLPDLRRVGCLPFPKSRPWEGMHLFFENDVPNLVKLWSGKFKGMDTGVEDYEIPDATWELIWQETADAVQHLPAQFVRVLGSNPSYYTAEAWCFWFVFLAPILLEGRFPDPKYHQHLCDFSDIIKVCLQFTVTHDQVAALRIQIVDWVRLYERYYYQFDESRLCACTLTIHGLLHVPDDLLFCGPMWTTWSFFIERYCGFLQKRLRSKRFPWANLNNTILHMAYLQQLGLRYDLEDELSSVVRSKKALNSSGTVYEGYPEAILRVPYKSKFTPDQALRQQVAHYFSQLLGCRPKSVLVLLPAIMPSFGKLQIKDGDSIRSVSACGDGSTAERNMSFVRYEIQVRRTQADPWVVQIFYGQLERILVCVLPNHKDLGMVAGKRRILAVTVTLLPPAIMPTSRKLAAAEENIQLREQLKAQAELIASLERDAAAHRSAARPNKLIPRPEGQAGRSSGYNTRDEMYLEDDADHYNRLFRIVRDHVNQYLNVGLTISKQDKIKVEQTILKITKAAPYFAKFQGSWPAYDMIGGYLRNLRTRRNRDLRDEKAAQSPEPPSKTKSKNKKKANAKFRLDSDESEEEDTAMFTPDSPPPNPKPAKRKNIRSDDERQSKKIKPDPLKAPKIPAKSPSPDLELGWDDLPQNCPACLESLPNAPVPRIVALFVEREALMLEGGSSHPRMPSLEMQLCRAITQENDRSRFERMGLKNKWPTIIDFDALPGRVAALGDNILELIEDADALADSLIWQTFLIHIDHKIFKFARSNAKDGFTYAQLGSRCGYYGPKGAIIIESALTLMFDRTFDLTSQSLYNTLNQLILQNEKAFDKYDDTSNLIELPDFISFILVPFTASLLIAEDLDLDLLDATDACDNSCDFGELMHPEVESGRARGMLEPRPTYDKKAVKPEEVVPLIAPKVEKSAVKAPKSTKSKNPEEAPTTVKKTRKTSAGAEVVNTLAEAETVQPKQNKKNTNSAEFEQPAPKRKKIAKIISIEEFDEPAIKSVKEAEKEEKRKKVVPPKPNAVQSSYGTRSRSTRGKD
ncbi:hypothetical protein C8R46DRAFT_1357483 [Mycena filopes]|nr:hypothetical protein C8R46DRAFT_1357483 [Mycena filopes]